MKWINFFTDYNIPYCIYKLNKEDNIVINNSENNNDKSIIIIYGSIYIIKIFTETRITPLVILNNNSIFNLNKINTKTKFYYKLIALEQTYLISFKLNSFSNTKKINKQIILSIINSYQRTLNRYEVINEIINQKYIKNKLILLILFLCLDIGIIEKNKVYIPFKISQKHLAIMIGAKKNNINKMIQDLCEQKFIHYSNKKKISLSNIFNNHFEI